MPSSDDISSVVLPVHNQADHLESVVASYLDAMAACAFEAPAGRYELILVPNGCTDDSEAICADLAKRYPAVRVVPSPTTGWGAAVRAGIAAAAGEVICYTNLARTSADDLLSALSAAEAHPESVTKADRQLRDSRKRQLGSTLYNLEARVLFGVKVRDINGTPKVFPRRFGALLNLRSDGDLIDLEFVARCARNGYPIRSVPIASTVRHGGASTTNWRSARRMYGGALRLRAELVRRDG